MVKIISSIPQEPTEPFPGDVYPPTVSNFVEKASLSLNCNYDFIGVAVLFAAATVIGSKAKIKVDSDWIESAMVWTCIIAGPGRKKTPAIKKAIVPLLKIQQEFGEVIRSWKENGGGTPIPKFETLITTDTTVEALYENLVNNLHGLGLYMDELSGWVDSMGQYKGGGGNDRQLYLSIWPGTTSNKNRTGKIPLQVDNPFLCIIGGLQTDLISVLEQHKNCGLPDRFLFTRPDAIPFGRTGVELTESVKNKYEELITRIYREQRKNQAQTFAFTREAQALWNEWDTEYLKSMNDPYLPGFLQEAYSKLEAYNARLSLILEFLWCYDEGRTVAHVGEKSLKHSIKLINYFKAHVTNIYNSFDTSKVDKRIERAIAWLAKQPNGIATLRQVYTNRVGGAKNFTEAYDLLMEMRSRSMGKLEEYNEVAGGSRKGYMFYLNPKLIKPTTQNDQNNG